MDSQVISKVLYLSGNIVRIYLIYQFLKVFFSVEGSRFQIILRAVCFGLFFFINSAGFLFFHWEAILVMISNLIGVFVITLTYSGKWGYRVSAAILIVTLNLICEELVYKFLLELNIGHIVVITMAISNLLFFMVILILQKISDFRHGENILFLEWLEIILIPVISIVITVVTFDRCRDEVAVMVGGIGLLILNIFVFYLFDHLVKLYRTQVQLMELEAQAQAYEKQLSVLAQSEEKISSLRHDMKNHIIALQQMAGKTKSKELQEYLRKMDSFTQTEGRFASTGDPFIDGFLNLKLSEAAAIASSEIICDIRIANNLVIDKMDFSILLGNLLDNAIQAMGKCEGRKQLNFLMEEKRGLLFVRLENSYTGAINKQNSVFLTTKKEKAMHGIGLKNVRRIVNKYEGILHFDYTDHRFTVELLLPIDNRKKE